jgi:hypothetical protein
MLTNTTTTNPALTNPPLTAELLRLILAGEAEVEPRMAAAVEAADSARAFVCPYCANDNDGVPRIQSHGLGVESQSVLLEWLSNPASRDFCLCQLTCLTSQTGSEMDDTRLLAETYMLPLLRYFRIRFVEIARKGPAESEGIVIFQDTREPRELHTEGAYTLAEHMRRNGVAPQTTGDHRCAYHFKIVPAEHWLSNHFKWERTKGTVPENVSPAYVAFGYNSEEEDRAAKSDRSYEKRNLELKVAFGFNSEEEDRAAKARAGDARPRMAFGFNSDEGDRAARSATHDFMRIGIYPLIDWGWSRERALQSIIERLGVTWQRSHCGFCPFARDHSRATVQGVARMKQHPRHMAEALMIEYGSLCLNERGALYNKKTLRAVMLSTEQQEALRLFEEMLDGGEHALLEVKRIYTAPKTAARSVVKIAQGTRVEMTEAFDRHVARLGLAVKSVHGINYGVFAERGETYPALEAFLVVAPSRIGAKVRGSFAAFEERFARVAGELGVAVPSTPGTELIVSQQEQGGLFDAARAA